jgi:hypothetical protein
MRGGARPGICNGANSLACAGGAPGFGLVKLIAARQGRTDKLDQLLCVRRDGSATSTSMPHAGQTLSEAALALNARWQQVAPHATLELELPGL